MGVVGSRVTPGLRFIALAPLVGAAVYLLARLALTDPGLVARYNWWEYFSTKIVATTGSLLAMSVFDRGTKLWLAWLFAAVNYLAFLALIVVAGPGHLVDGAVLPAGTDVARSLLLATGSIAGVASSWCFALAFAGTGLLFRASERGRVAVYAACFVVALLLILPSLTEDVLKLPSRGVAGIGLLVSELADLGSIVLLAPLFLTVVSLRGGVLVWPFALVLASNVVWVLWDFLVPATRWAGIDPTSVRTLKETFRVVATLYIPAAGVSQWLLARARPA
jgi:hypothetical protein